ncbi:MAG TPA: hypothetical protein VJO12_00215 [Stellaceae bacterium]|nr:hypothetical protein [Stellaceae bacterium]
MTAQIISLVDYRNRHSAAAEPDADQAARDFDASLMPVIVRPAAAPPARRSSGEATIVIATAALSAACRDMAANLATLMSHAEAACHSIGNIGETAEALIRTGADMQEVAATFKQDHDRMSSELSDLGLAGRTL